MIYEPINNFYNQKMNLINIREPRFIFFSDVCKNKKVMHIGCADAMAFKEDSNLHIYLSKTCEGISLDGLDIDFITIKKLEELCPGKYYVSYDVKDEYDLVLIPEVIEHVSNVGSFLGDIFSIKSKEYLFTAPSLNGAQFFFDDEFALEMVHPDHKYWFSPYTLYNTIKPFSEGFDMKMYYLENKSQIGIRLN